MCNNEQLRLNKKDLVIQLTALISFATILFTDAGSIDSIKTVTKDLLLLQFNICWQDVTRLIIMYKLLGL